MKKFLWIFILVCLVGCSEESDCFKNQGKETIQTMSLETFDRIHIGTGIELTIEQSDEFSIEIKAGENRINRVEAKVENGELKISDLAECQLFRSVNAVKVLVKTPTLERIYSLSQYPTRSQGKLTFPKLALETGLNVDSTPSIFEFEIENDTLILQDNVATQFKIRGKTQYLEVNFWASAGRLEAAEFQADEIKVFHRSSNDMIVYPKEKIVGKLMSTGNLILKNIPPIVEIEQVYTGHVVYP